MRRSIWSVTIAAAAAVATAAAVSVTLFRWGNAETYLLGQTWCLAAAALWIAAARPGPRAGRVRIRDRVPSMLVALAILAVTCLVRWWLLGMLPPPDRTGFEELQMGSDGYRVLTSGILPLEFRFSKALSALGLLWGGENIRALRLPFQLMGYGRLVVLYLCLRALRVGRHPSAFVTVSAGTVRWFVITGGMAYEDFSPMFAMQLLLLCLIKVDQGQHSAAAWTALAGALAGILAFENSSFRFLIVLAAVWIVWLAAGRGRGGWERWRPPAYFFGIGCVAALPMLVDVAHKGGRSIFFEAIMRYGHERDGLLPTQFLASVGDSLALIAGKPMRISFYLAAEADPVIPPLFGVLLLGGAVMGLVVRGRPLVRALVLVALGAVVVCSATTNFFAPSRLAPVLSILLLPAGVLLEDIGGLARKGLGMLAARLGPRGRGLISGARVGEALVYGLLAVLFVAGSARRVAAMAADPDVWNEYLNDQYVTASYLGQVGKPGMPAIAVTPGLRRDWSSFGLAQWVFARRDLRVTGMTAMPAAESVAAGTLVVLRAEGRPLRDGEIAELRDLAGRTASAHTLRFLTEHGDRVVLGSVCVRCEVGVAGGGS